jgi:2-methylcitrate dehydratase PrpD
VPREFSENISERLGAWISALSLGHVPDDAQHIARRCIIDTIAVAIGGSRTPVAEKLSAHVTSQYGSGPCSLLGTPNSTSSVGAALANGCAAHALDFDDTSYAGVVHGSTIVLPAVLAAAEQAELTGSGFLEAFVAGSEATYALGLTLTKTHYLSGWWATSTLGAIGAAAGAAKALGLDEGETAKAISFAALQANGMIAVLGTDSKPVIAGQAARLGLESALLAAQKNSAPMNAFEDRRGLLKLMNEGRQDEAGLAELGKRWRLLEPGIAIKRAPVCSATQAAIEVTQNLIAEHKLEPSEIKSVFCEVAHLVKISLVHDKPSTPSEAQFSMPFAVGCVLVFGQLGPQQITPETLQNKALQETMTRVEMVEADDLNGPEFQPAFPECARVTLLMSSGEEFTGFLGAPTGMPSNPMSDDELSGKFRTCTTFAGWTKDRAEDVLAALWEIENAPSIRELLRGDS